MPAPKVKPIGDVAPKWNRRASSAGPEYEAGITTTPNDWQANAIAAKGAWQQGVTQAAGRDGYAKGVQAAGNAKWQNNAKAKGVPRFGQGVAVGEADYARAFAPFLEAIGRVDLPNRGPRGSEANLNRMQQIPRALAALKRR